MIASFVSPTRGDLTSVRAVNLPRIDARAVHFAAIFMKGVVTMYLLDACCDFPVDRKNVCCSLINNNYHILNSVKYILNCLLNI